VGGRTYGSFSIQAILGGGAGKPPGGGRRIGMGGGKRCQKKGSDSGFFAVRGANVQGEGGAGMIRRRWTM